MGAECGISLMLDCESLRSFVYLAMSYSRSVQRHNEPFPPVTWGTTLVLFYMRVSPTDSFEANLWEGPANSICQLIMILLANAFLAARLDCPVFFGGLDRVFIRIPASTTSQRVPSGVV